MATATTPNSHRQATQSLNSRPHSVRTVSCAQLKGDSRPPAPPFVEQQLRFVQALGATNGAGPTSVPMQTSRIDGRTATAAVAAASRKRAAVEQDDARSPDAADKRQTKRSRGTGAGQPLAALTVNAPAGGAGAGADGTKRKSRKSYAGAEKEKLQHESQQWRAKYRKAFPSFTFYFDAIDDSTKASLSAAVKKLGAVRLRILAVPPCRPH